MNRLNRLAVVDAALALADREGLEAVSMRKVARELEVAPMSIYRHVANKAELFDLMLDRVIQRLLPVAATGAAWETAVRAMAHEARRLLARHPSWLPLLTRPIAPRSALSLFERLAAAMARERVSPKRKLHAVTSLMCFVLGFVLVERMMLGGGTGAVPLAQLRAAFAVTAAAPATYPRLDALAGAVDRWSFDQAFEVGLDTFLAEIRGARAA
ncbi:MAG: TetR/AcrR family transcriptional regulator C-terminal domain-containing protein [Labilithrix sp.]|nr:TetR/AcrR family transcriptional regulator C-terminal domain-containing protein [Labilithrix sp.]MCW5812635.1 TetR/AcrR family transcriptional regulator C-terminal domain-containing protein [Labilithrix sp.]